MKIKIEKNNKDFVRVGCTYYKVIKKDDRYNIKGRELKVWKKEEIIQDYGKEFIDTIPSYDDFIMKPDNVDFKPYFDNCYNLYHEFKHAPKEGEWKWTKVLLEQIFGEQYELGLRYMQILYLYPQSSTVILALVSTERQTGKTTFLNWLNMIFGANMTVISPSDFTRDFNSSYGTKNIIAMEETMLDKKSTLDKLKALVTQKTITINAKYVPEYTLPFFGKFILTSNDEDKFAMIDKEEIRFFVRKLCKPKIINHNIENDLIQEIPSFLNYLRSLPTVDWSISRSGFSIEELNNDGLKAVVAESRSRLYKDILYKVSDFFDKFPEDKMLASVNDLKNRFWTHDNNISINDIRGVLKREFLMQPEINQRYKPFINGSLSIGRPYLFSRIRFCNEPSDIVINNVTNNCCLSFQN